MDDKQAKVGNVPYADRIKSPVLDEGNVEEKRKEIKEYFNQTFSIYEDLFNHLITPAAYYTRADPLRHPLIFYYGHTACFFINKFIANLMWSERIDPHIESICAVGVDELSWDDLDEKNYNWPTVEEVKEYRNKVRAVVNKVIDTVDLKVPIRWDDHAWIILMGIEHERIHLETSNVLIRQLLLTLVQPLSNWPICNQSGTPPSNLLLPVVGGNVTLGRNDLKYYGWDNEFGSYDDVLPDFMVSQYKVTNKEFLEFVQAKGYTAKEFWTEEGWEWVEFQKVTMPRFWRHFENSFKLRCIAEEIPMPWDWPVEVNYFEAKAFCNWLTHKTQRTIRLPTETEWVHLRRTEFPSTFYPNWGVNAPGNIDLANWASSCPVTKFQHGRFFDLIGNVWEWCESSINAFPGFKQHSAYDDFSTPTFDGKHNIIKGGSWISTGNEALDNSRYAFRRHMYQHAGLRYVASEETIQVEMPYYETDTLLAQYLEFHFGQPYFGTENYSKTIVTHALNALGNNHPRHRAMDLGSAVGRASFELARHFEEVVGVDFSVRFISSAVTLQQKGKIKWEIIDEGNLTNWHEMSLAQLDFRPKIVQKVKFIQGDACNLKDNLTNFDLVIAANLIDRLYDPIKFLESIPTRITTGGILAISSPYTWLQEQTESSKWLGGYKESTGEKVTTLRRLKEILSIQFDLVSDPVDVEFVIRETTRKFQHTFAQLTLWRKKF